MNRPMIRIHNLETNEIIDREMTVEEYKIYQEEEKIETLRQAEAEARESARQALLSRLGITQEEAQLLLGGK